MKIVQVVNTLAVSDGGPARNSFELNVTLNQLPGVSARLFWVHGEQPESVLSGYDGEAGPLPAHPPQKVKSVGSLIRVIARCDALIIHGYYLSWIFPVLWAAKALGVTAAITPHGSLTRHQQRESMKKKRIFDQTIGRLIRSLADGFVTGSEIEAAELIEKFPGSNVVSAGVGTTMPRGISIHSRPWGTPLRLLALSRIAPKKRHDLMLDAVSELTGRGLDVHLDIVGSGSEAEVERIQSHARMLGVSDLVTFHGQKTGAEKAAFYRASDIYLLPSDDENFGISLAESLANGLPAVVSAGVASGKFMSAGAGKVLEKPTGETIADAVEQMMAGDRASFQKAARFSAEESFSWAAAGKRWVSAIRELEGVRAPR